MHYYKFNLSDWSLSTSHLTLEEEAIYFRLINFYYDTELPIPTETKQVFRRLRIGSHADLAMCILGEFFELEPDGWHHRRCDSVISEYHGKAETSRENGKKGGRPSKRSLRETQKNPAGFVREPRANPDETLTKNQEPLTNNHNLLVPESEKPTRSQGSRFPPDFEFPDEWRTWAKTERSDVDPDDAFSRFRDYWISQPGVKGRKADWFATWRNWIRSTRKEEPKNGFLPRETSFDRGVRERREWLEEQERLAAAGVPFGKFNPFT